MPNEFVTSGNAKVTEKDLVMTHLREILTITRKEFRPAYSVVTENGGIRQETIADDNRKAYIQAVESLSDILAPYYDDKTKEVEAAILKELDELREKSEGESEEYIKQKFRLMRKLFRQLSFLLKEKEYLAGTSHTEDGDEPREEGEE